MTYLTHFNRMVTLLERLSPGVRAEVAYDLVQLSRKWCDCFADMYESNALRYSTHDLEQVANAAAFLEAVSEIILLESQGRSKAACEWRISSGYNPRSTRRLTRRSR